LSIKEARPTNMKMKLWEKMALALALALVLAKQKVKKKTGIKRG